QDDCHPTDGPTACPRLELPCHSASRRARLTRNFSRAADHAGCRRQLPVHLWLLLLFLSRSGPRLGLSLFPRRPLLPYSCRSRRLGLASPKSWGTPRSALSHRRGCRFAPPCASLALLSGGKFR